MELLYFNIIPICLGCLTPSTVTCMMGMASTNGIYYARVIGRGIGYLMSEQRAIGRLIGYLTSEQIGESKIVKLNLLYDL